MLLYSGLSGLVTSQEGDRLMTDESALPSSREPKNPTGNGKDEDQTPTAASSPALRDGKVDSTFPPALPAFSPAPGDESSAETSHRDSRPPSQAPQDKKSQRTFTFFGWRSPLPSLSPRSAVIILMVTVAAGLLFGAAASSARVTGAGAESTLAGFVRDQQEVVFGLEDSVEDLRAERDEAWGLVLPESSDQPQPEQLLLRGELSGPGVVVTLDDAPADFQLDDQTDPNVAVVHQQDVDAVMNALWGGGAEAMSVQGVRVTASTPVRCVGNVILVGSRSYSPPYRIVAIGEPERMVRFLEQDSSVTLYREDAARYQMGWDVQVVSRTTVPAAAELPIQNFAVIAREG